MGPASRWGLIGQPNKVLESHRDGDVQGLIGGVEMRWFFPGLSLATHPVTVTSGLNDLGMPKFKKGGGPLTKEQYSSGLQKLHGIFGARLFVFQKAWKNIDHGTAVGDPGVGGSLVDQLVQK